MIYWGDEHRLRITRSMQHDMFLKIGRKPITEITTPELLTVVRAVEDRGALGVASRIVQRCTSVFRYAIQTGRATNKPATDFSGVVHTRRVQYIPSIPIAELPGRLLRSAFSVGH